MHPEGGSPRLSCPSAQPELPGSAVIGVVGRRDGRPHVALLPQPVPLDAVAPLIPESIPATEVLRFGAPCAEHRCGHFDGTGCTLATRIVARLPPVVDRLAPCALRPTCRWWHQEGPAACRRCPQIVTEPLQAGESMRALAMPASTSSTTGESDHA